VLRVDFKSTEALALASANDSTCASTSTTGDNGASMWSRLFRHFTLQTPLLNRLLPKLKCGRLMLEVGDPAVWKQFDVVLAGSSMVDLGLYYYNLNKRDAPPLGCVHLHSAHIDVLEEVVMVVTTDKTWFLCAEHAREANDWAEAICATIEKVSQGVLLEGRSAARRRLSSTVTAVTLREIQSREPHARVDEFLEVFVKSNSEDVRIQTMKGALSWSCMRNLAWKLWLDYLPLDVPFKDWIPIAKEKRQKYSALRKRHSIFSESLHVAESCEDFIHSCEATEDALLYDIYKDVRRTRGSMPYFRDPVVQCMLIRILYTYSNAHPEVSYNQGMGELLATIVYLLHIEQWPSQKSTKDDADMSASILSTSSFENVHSEAESDSDDGSYVYVESFIDVQPDGSYLDRDTFLRMSPFTGGAARYSDCCRDAVEEIIREITNGEFLEHDAYLLLEEVMIRMAGAYCPEAPPPSSSRKTFGSKKANAASSPTSITSYVMGHDDSTTASPLYDQMNSIHNHILRRCDPPTARHLSHLGIEPQMFSLRWVRVLMSREFEMAQVWQVWDAIFSVTPCDFSFINLLCVAAVREFRDEILAVEDATSVLLCFRDLSDRIDADRLVDNARELYEALLLAAAVEASNGFS
uniref:Rab-GAP TBC domain-containing protein n=1 Tax=Globisporangium ultimum (strain ATCC 200006 / CBS 805.95 / DAOM BR144) TaxID=431595 RepID=K3W7N5_GLOUD